MVTIAEVCGLSLAAPYLDIVQIDRRILYRGQASVTSKSHYARLRSDCMDIEVGLSSSALFVLALVRDRASLAGLKIGQGLPSIECGSAT